MAPARGLAEDDPDLVRMAVVGERDRGAGARQDSAVQFDRCHPATDSLRVLDDDLVLGRVITEVDLVARPGAGNAGIEQEGRSPQSESEDPLDAGLVHPSRRSGVPGPTAAADVRRFRVDVSRHDVRLDLVTLDPG